MSHSRQKISFEGLDAVGDDDPEERSVQDAWRFYLACREKLGIANPLGFGS